MVDWGKNFYLFLASLSDRLGKSKESRVRASSFLRDENTFSSRITFANTLGV